MIGDWFAGIDWSATGAMISGLSTLVVAFLTFVLIKENKLLRRAGNSPVVVAHLETHPDGNGAVKLAFSNVGTGPALDVSYSVKCDQEDFKNYDVLFRYADERPPLTMIGQGEKFDFIFAVAFRLFQPKDPKISRRLKPFRVKVSWRSVGNTKIQSATYLLDVAAYNGLPGIAPKPPLVKISEDLSGIKKHLEKMARDSSGPSPFVDTTAFEQGTRTVVKGKTRTD